MIQNRVMQMIRKNDIRDENGELLNFGTHTFRHCYGKKLTEMHIDDWDDRKAFWGIKHYKVYIITERLGTRSWRMKRGQSERKSI